MDCIVIGDIFFDIIISGFFSTTQIIQGGVSYSNTINIFPGGAGNVAVGLSRLGGSSFFIGKAGNDEFKKIYEKNLKKENIKYNIFIDKNYNTGIAITIVDMKGERSFILSRGANDYLNSEEINKCRKQIINSNYLYVCGYSLIRSPQQDSILNAVKIAKSAGTKIVFDPGAFNLINEKKKYFDKIIDMSDVITPNLKEAKAIVNLDDISDILKNLSKRVPLVALKMGEAGCIIKNKTEQIKCSNYNVKCVDTTGAGDSFVSALIYGLSNKLPLKKIAKLANWYAAYNVQYYGARSYPDVNMILNFMKKTI